MLFVATAEAGDAEMRARIEEHRRARPASWRTLEAATDVGRQIEARIGDARVVIVDCITLLVNNVFNLYGSDIEAKASLVEEKTLAEIRDLAVYAGHLNADFIIVTNEVGLGLVPTTALGRLYRDLLGKANQMLAAQADQVYFMVSGLPLRIKPATTNL